MTYSWHENKIVMRQAFAYTPEGAIGLVSTDDGTDPDVNNLKGATYRKILYMTLDRKFPLGIPAMLEEKVLDLETKQEVLLKAIKHFFSPEGLLIKQEIYDADNQLSFTREWAYDNKGKMVRQWNTMGNEIHWGYDEKGNRNYEKGPRQDKYKKIFYDNLGRITRVDEVHGDKTLSTEYRYDTVGRKISEIDVYGNETNYVYDAIGNLIQVIEPEVEIENGKTIRPITMYTYHQSLPISKIDPKGNTTQYVFVKKDLPAQIIHPDGSEERFEYDEHGEVCKKVDKDGYTTLITRDYLGRIIKLERLLPSGQSLWVATAEYNSLHMIAETDALGVTTKYTYDLLGRKIKQVRGSEIISFVNDACGRVIKEIREISGSEPLVVVFAYDALDRIIEEREEDSFGNKIRQKNYVYNEDGLTKIITFGKEGAEATQIEVDSYGMKQTKDPYGNTTIEKCYFNYENSLGQTVPYKEVIAPTGVKTVYVQDTLHRDKEIRTSNPFDVVIAKKELSYDILGNLSSEKEIIFLNNGGTKECVNTYEYDSVHRCIAKIEGANSEHAKRTSYRYNNCGKVISVEKPSGVKLLYNYNPEGLLNNCYANDNSVFYTYSYDSKNRLIAINDKVTKTKHTFSYNASNQLVEEVFPNGLAIKFEYDVSGNKIATTLPDGSKIRYKYALGMLKAIERVTPAGDISYTHTYNEYNLSGLPVEETLLDRAGKVIKGYDKLGKLCFVEANHYKETIPNEGWDPLRKIVKKIVKDAKGELESTFRYNYLGQLIYEKDIDAHTYLYHSSGDLVAKDELSFLYNDLNQVVQVGKKQLSYDLDGNLLSDGQAQYAYDALGRLTFVKKGKLDISYIYDAFGRRLTKVIKSFKGDQQLEYFYDDNVEIGCYNNGIPHELCVFGVDGIIAIELQKKTYTPIRDCSGNISALLSHAGHLVEGYHYSRYGDEVVIDSKGKAKQPINPWRFSSKRFDKETGLYSIDGRFYSSELGIFITQEIKEPAFYNSDKDSKIGSTCAISSFAL